MTAIFDLFKKRFAPQQKEFTLYEWEVWHTYSTYFIEKINKLDQVAKTLVSSDIAEYSCTSKGDSYWRTPVGYKTGKCSVKLEISTTKAQFRLKTVDDTEPEIDGYALECFGISVNLRYAELRLFSGDRNVIPDYVRAFLSPCQLVHSDFGLVQCYPIITLYESGVILIHFRIIGPEHSVTLSEFIDGDINVNRVNFENIFVPPAIAKFLPLVSALATERRPSLIARLQFARKFSRHKRIIEKLVWIDDAGDFEYKFVNLEVGDQDKTTTSLAHDLFYIVSYLCKLPSQGLIPVLRWPQVLANIGHYWCGRPHIHIIRHSGQADTASHNEDLYKSEFNKILFRASADQRDINSFPLPPSARPFEDYAVYCGSAGTLWVWSRQGIDKQKRIWNDKNRDHFIYEQQVQVEVLEYGHMLYRSLIEQTQNLSNRTTIFRSRQKLANLTLQMSEVSPYGEIRDFLQSGWDVMGVNLLRTHLQDSLQILENRVAIDETEGRERFQIGLTIIFGIMAIPPFASEVVKPVWEILHLWQPKSEDLTELLYIALSVIVVTLLIMSITKYRHR